MHVRRLAVFFAIAAALSASAGPVVESGALTVDGRNDDATTSGLTVAGGDLLLTFASGSVTLGPWIGASGPWGKVSGEAEKGTQIALGTLVMKVGSKATAVGERAFKTITDSGELKFKVNDTIYGDNKGTFDVAYMVIRSGTLPEPVRVAGDSEPPKTDSKDALIRRVITVEGTNDEWTSTGVVVEPGDWIGMSASGKVSGTTADGMSFPVRAPNTRRALTYKIGTGASVFAGSSTAVMATTSGTLKLRVFDTDYAANQGAFVVHLILVRPSLVQRPQAQEAANDVAEANLENSPDVDAVRQRYKSVNDRQRVMTKTTKSIWGMSAEGAELVSYADAGKIKKLVVAIFGEGGKSSTEMYFNDGAIDFAYETSVGWFPGPPPREASEARMYFRDGRLLWLTTGADRKPATRSQYADAERTTLELAQQMLLAAKTPGDSLDFDSSTKTFKKSSLPASSASPRPAPAMIGDDATTTGVDRAALIRFVTARKAGVLACYQKELQLNPTLRGKIVVRFSIATNGRATGIEIDENYLGSNMVAACVKNLISTWVFPFKPDADVPVALPFVFSPEAR